MLFNDNTFWRFFNPFAINQKDIQLIVVGCFFCTYFKKNAKTDIYHFQMSLSNVI